MLRKLLRFHQRDGQLTCCVPSVVTSELAGQVLGGGTIGEWAKPLGTVSTVPDGRRLDLLGNLSDCAAHGGNHLLQSGGLRKI